MSLRVSRFDRELAELPESLRWREWMARVEAAIFAAPRPDPRETLAPLVGEDCRLDDLLADIAAELRARPYEIVFVAGGFQFRTRPRYAEALRSLANVKHAGPPSFTTLEMQALSAIAYLQPITRAELSRLAGRDISRDVLGRLKNSGVIAAGPRAPEPGAPIAWVTTQRFLEVFALGSLRDLPDLETLDAMNVLAREVDHDAEGGVDHALGLSEVDGAGVGETMLDQTEIEA